ncbi:MAG: DUF6496 domain-containing protein [Acidobacteriota bacterium]
MHERKRGTLKSGGSGKKVTSRKQAIAIGLSEERSAGGKVPAARGRSSSKKLKKSTSSRKASSTKASSSRKSTRSGTAKRSTGSKTSSRSK